MLNPKTNYTLKVLKTLKDTDNYPLVQDYNYNFTTNDILNRDKRLTYLDYSNNVLIPKDIDPISV
jgi:hypothetical protein